MTWERIIVSSCLTLSDQHLITAAQVSLIRTACGVVLRCTRYVCVCAELPVMPDAVY